MVLSPPVVMTTEAESKRVGVPGAGYRTRVSYDIEDPEWDTFLAATPGGDPLQTSLWAQVKAPFGWRPARVVVTREDRIVAGVQLLVRALPLVGAVGYAPRGPLVAGGDPGVTHLVLDELHRVALATRIQYLMVQPPCNGEALAQQLPNWGFRPSPVIMAPTATIRFDLSRDLDDLLAQMRKKTRQHIRNGLRAGVTVREGTESDVSTFYRLHVATSERQKFLPYPEVYFSRLWRLLSPHGYIKVFLAEWAGAVVSALVALIFRDTVYTLAIGWSGRHGECRPNEVLYWSTLIWAKAHGYRYCDFTWIDPRAARAVVSGEPFPDSLRQTPTFFKLGFGGQVTLFPGGYDYVYNPVLRRVYHAVGPKIYQSSMVRNVLNHLRWRWLPPLRHGRGGRGEPGPGTTVPL